MPRCKTNVVLFNIIDILIKLRLGRFETVLYFVFLGLSYQTVYIAYKVCDRDTIGCLLMDQICRLSSKNGAIK